MAIQSLENMAQHDLQHAISGAMWRGIRQLLTRKNEDLLAFNEVAAAHQFKGPRYAGLQSVPIDSIVGSLSRCRDFDRKFYPRRIGEPDRWKRIAKAYYQGIDLPPVELYKIGDSYFVVDGNHRISVARALGQQYVDARVTEFELA